MLRNFFEGKPEKLGTGNGYKIPDSEQFFLVRCSSKYGSWLTSYRRIHMRLAGKQNGSSLLHFSLHVSEDCAA